VREGLVPLRFGDDVNGFRVDLRLRESSLTASQQYGVAFRIQDDNNYLLFSVDAATSAWTLSAIENVVMRGLQTGTLDALPSELIVSAENEFIRIELGDMPIQQTFANWQSGAVALWLPFNEDVEPVTISSLSISLIGTDATLAQDSELSDLPVIAPLQFLSEDVEALRSTGDENAIVNCSQFMTIYERLENHLIIEGTTDFVAQARAISTVIFNRCQLERESRAVEFTFSDYLNWEQGLSELVSEIQAAQ
jgi:hypothetical protein